MNCEEFKEKVVDLFDKNVDGKTKSECEQHVSQCPECKKYYKELRQAFEEIHPNVEPVSKKNKRRPMIINRYRQTIAMAAMFILGVIIGGTHLFTNTVKADNTAYVELCNAMRTVKNVGSFQMDFFMRTKPNENFEYVNPEDDFVKINIKLTRQDGMTFYRVEKENGRTLVCNGKEQYLWWGDNYFKYNSNYNGLGRLANLLIPEKLLDSQKSAVELSKDVKVTKVETESTVEITTEGMETYEDLSRLFETGSMDDCKVVVKNVFSKNDGLLRSVKVCIIYKGVETLVMYADDIQYNVMLTVAEVTSLPETEWIQSNNEESVSAERLSELREETAEQAARRIVEAIISGDFEKAQEALYGYKNIFNDLHDGFEGCSADGFVAKTDKSYVGVYVFYKLRRPDGKVVKRHIALRNDNSRNIWVADGGL
ncbi:MAG: hypothetical protein Q4F69_10190 [Bacteroidia bacterium]|nr:hypothetical protein [Bacteroidia bacterium]